MVHLLVKFDEAELVTARDIRPMASRLSSGTAMAQHPSLVSQNSHRIALRGSRRVAMSLQDNQVEARYSSGRSKSQQVLQ